MPVPYSDDFRQKAVDAVDRGERKSKVCQMFNISRNMLDLWLKHRELTSSISAIRDYYRGPPPKSANLEASRLFAKANGRLTQEQMAKKWPEPISAHTLGKALQKIDFTRRKRPMAIANEMSNNAKHL